MASTPGLTCGSTLRAAVPGPLPGPSSKRHRERCGDEEVVSVVALVATVVMVVLVVLALLAAAAGRAASAGRAEEDDGGLALVAAERAEFGWATARAASQARPAAVVRLEERRPEGGRHAA